MKYAVSGICALFALTVGGVSLAGYDPVYQLAFGTFAVMALAIGATFLWLYYRRATPLALGMALSWAGSAGIVGWWYVFSLLEGPGAMSKNPLIFVFLATHIIGAVLHFRVIGSTLGWSVGAWFLIPSGGVLFTLALNAIV